jgi:hypothetical protein
MSWVIKNWHGLYKPTTNKKKIDKGRKQRYKDWHEKRDPVIGCVG